MGVIFNFLLWKRSGGIPFSPPKNLFLSWQRTASEKTKNRPARYLWLIRNGQEKHINSKKKKKISICQNNKCQYSICLLFPRRVLLAVSLPAKISPNYYFFLSIRSPFSQFHSPFAEVPPLFQSSFFILLKGRILFVLCFLSCFLFFLVLFFLSCFLFFLSCFLL